MALRYGFFNSVNHDRLYDADDISNYYLKLISNGVFATPANSMQVQAREGMTVSVTAGWGFINCKWLDNSAAYMLTLDASDVVLNRIDRIVMRLNPDEAHRNMEIAIKKGTPASTPVPPSLTRVENGVWELSLAQVYIGAGVTEITQSKITDERGNNEVCGWVTGLIDQINTTNLFAQYDAAFWEWFRTIKDAVSSTTLLRQYTNSYTTAAESEENIPINIPEYNETLDILNVYVNGLKLIPDVDYTKTNTTIRLSKPLDVIGTPVEFEVLKSIDGEDAGSVVDIVYQLQQEIGKLDQNNYYCNGVNDNVKLREHLTKWEAQQKKTLSVVGTFGVDSSTTTIDGTSYSMAYTSRKNIVIDFSQCDTISAKNKNFAYFSGCTVRNLAVKYDDVVQTDSCTGITCKNTTLENCSISGTLAGTGAFTGYRATDSRMIACDVDISAAGDVTGVKISETSTCDNSHFTAKTTGSSTIACGGSGGGSYSNCEFVGIAEKSSCGFFVNASNVLQAQNCTCRGYTKTGSGYGLTGETGSEKTLFLTGINCNQIPVTGYTQTGSMKFSDGYGFFSGCFYAAVSMPDTVVSYGSITRNVT